MAKTYYKYAERDAENQINWAEVGKNMSDAISEELKVREEKKAEIDKQQSENEEYVMNAPQGQHEGQAEYVMNYSEKVMETMRIQNQLLKEGKISLKDYNIQRANIMNGTKSVFGVMEEWNVKFDEAKIQMNSEEGLSNFDADGLMEVEKMGNYDAHSLYINPLDGKVSVGERQLKDPSKPHDPVTNPYTTLVVENENSLIPINEVTTYFEQIRPPLDTREAFADSVNTLAETYQVLLNSGYNKEDDIRGHKDYEDAKESMINAILGGSNATNSFDAQSLLSDYQGEIPDGFDNAGESFIFTQDPNDPRLFDADGNRNQYVILKVRDPQQPNSGRMVPQLTEEQIEMAKHVASETLDTMVDRSVTERTEFSPQQWQYKVEEKGQKEQALLTNLLDLYSGDHAAMESTMIGLMDLPGNEWIKNIERTNEGVIINKGLSDEEIIPLHDNEGNQWDEISFIKALAAKIGGIDDLALAFEVYGINNKDREPTTLTEMPTKLQNPDLPFDAVTNPYIIDDETSIFHTRTEVVEVDEEGYESPTPQAMIQYTDVFGNTEQITTDSIVSKLQLAEKSSDDDLTNEGANALEALMTTWLKKSHPEIVDNMRITANDSNDFITVSVPGVIVDSNGNDATLELDIDWYVDGEGASGYYAWMKKVVNTIANGGTIIIDTSQDDDDVGDTNYYRDQNVTFKKGTKNPDESSSASPD